MEDFLASFFITPFTGLAEGIATATSPLDVIDAVDGFVWGPIMILLLLGTHIFMTIRTGFIQRKIGTGIKLSVTKDDPSNADGDITQFGALTTALAATIGTGNIVGVGTGLLFGGPGAIFWMWITGILGIATKYSEVFIGVKYRVKDHSGKMLGGAMYALERGFKNKKAGRILAILFALFASLAAFGIGASTQSNSLADALYNTSLIDGKAIPQWLVGAVVVALVAIVILGGIKSISKVCEKLVPVMAVFYVVCCLIIIGMNGQFLGEAIRQIIAGAFTPAGAAGGAVEATPAPDMSDLPLDGGYAYLRVEVLSRDKDAKTLEVKVLDFGDADGVNVGALPVGAQGAADCSDLLSMAMMIDSGEWIITYADLGQQAFPLRLTSIENPEHFAERAGK